MPAPSFSSVGKPLPTTKYFLHPQYEYNNSMVERDLKTATGITLPGYAGYDTAQGRALIEKGLGKKVFSLMADVDPSIARFQLDKALP